MEPYNFIPKAIPDIQRFSFLYEKRGMPVAAQQSRLILVLLKESVSFMMPENGVLYESGYRGLKDVTVHLPYPVISIEYPARTLPEDIEKEDSHPEYYSTKSSKRIVLAVESSRLPASFFEISYFSDVQKMVDKGVVTVFVINFVDRNKLWTIQPSAAMIPLDVPGFSKSSGEEESCIYRNVKQMLRGELLLPYPITPIPALHEPYQEVTNRMSIEEKFMTSIIDLGGEVSAVMSLLEALSCINVGTQTLDPPERLNKKRIKNGHEPFVSYKVLTITGSDSGKTSKNLGGSHASPKMHLRRGHIRRLDENRRIWVNACIVGKAENGIAVKDYALNNASVI